MRSTPLFLGGKLYHIRYDLNAAWDMECMIPGGLYSILDRPLSLEVIADLLWFGLKWDNPDLTVLDTRKMLTRTIKGNRSLIHRAYNYFYKAEDAPVLLGVLTSCNNELFSSGWFSHTDQEDTTATPARTDTMPAEEPTGTDFINLLEEQMFYCGYPGDPWRLTPAEIFQYIKSYNDRTGAMQERLTGIKPKQVSGKKQTAEDQQNLIMQLNALCGGGLG